MTHLSDKLRKSQAFTLIEILVVMLLISIILTYILLNPSALRSQGSDENNFPKQLHASLQLSQIESILKQQAIKFKLNHDFYGFQYAVINDYFQTQWVWFDAKSILSKFYLEDATKVEFSQGNASKDIIFFPNSEVTPFVLTIYKNNISVATVSSDLAGDIALEFLNER